MRTTTIVNDNDRFNFNQEEANTPVSISFADLKRSVLDEEKIAEIVRKEVQAVLAEMEPVNDSDPITG